MGGAAAVKQQARAALERADYRWAATLLDHLVFADAGDAEARELLARTYDQLGYRAESGVWRSVYLSGANELRHGVAGSEVSLSTAMGLLERVPLSLFFAAMATRLNGPKAADAKPLALNFVFTDAGETHVLVLENAVLHHEQRDADPNAAVTVRFTRDLFLRMATGQVGLRELIFSDDLHVEGSRMELLSFFMLLDPVEPNFAIVTP
jgi:alkyl sulfatase BDS1-like metallo-beta-lactamase superfamily hydrolase